MIGISARRVLHVACNVVDAAASVQFLAATATLEARMRSGPIPAQGTHLGLAAEVSAEVDTTFLYDARGPRSAPAIEAVEWLRPAAVIAADPRRPGPGPHTLVVAHEDVASCAASVRAAGGRTLPERPGFLGPDAVVAAGPGGLRVAFVPARPDERRYAVATVVGLWLDVTDLAASVDWYRAVGFTADGSASRAGVDRPADDVRALVLPDDEPSFALHLAPTEMPERDTDDQRVFEGVGRIALVVDDVRASVARLRLDGINIGDAQAFPLPGKPDGGLLIAFTRDPDGGVVELVQRPRGVFRPPRRRTA